MIGLNDNTVTFTGIQPAALSPGVHAISALNVNFWNPGQLNYLFHFGIITTTTPTARVVLESSVDGVSGWTPFVDTGVLPITSGLRSLVIVERGTNPNTWVRGFLTLGGVGGVVPCVCEMVLTNFLTVGRTVMPFSSPGIQIVEWAFLPSLLAPTHVFSEDLTDFLETLGFGVRNTTLFRSNLPDTTPAGQLAVCVYDNPGATPDNSHDGTGYDEPGAQIVTRSASATDYAAAADKADEIYRMLRLITNQTLNGTRYLRIRPTSNPIPLIRESPTERHRLSFNVSGMRAM